MRYPRILYFFLATSMAIPILQKETFLTGNDDFIGGTSEQIDTVVNESPSYWETSTNSHTYLTAEPNPPERNAPTDNAGESGQQDYTPDPADLYNIRARMSELKRRKKEIMDRRKALLERKRSQIAKEAQVLRRMRNAPYNLEDLKAQFGPPLMELGRQFQELSILQGWHLDGASSLSDKDIQNIVQTLVEQRGKELSNLDPNVVVGFVTGAAAEIGIPLTGAALNEALIVAMPRILTALMFVLI